MNKITSYCMIILMSFCIGVCVWICCELKEMNRRLELAEKAQIEFIERLNEYQAEEREYIDRNDAELENKISEAQEDIRQISNAIESVVRERVLGKFNDSEDFGECANKKND